MKTMTDNPVTQGTELPAVAGPPQSYFVALGREVSTLIFDTDESANLYMVANAGWGLIGIDRAGNRHIAQVHDKGTLLPDVRNLMCCCCGERFRGRQLTNQDIGWGLGDCCVEYVRARVDEHEESTYGRPGIHYYVGRSHCQT